VVVTDCVKGILVLVFINPELFSLAEEEDKTPFPQEVVEEEGYKIVVEMVVVKDKEVVGASVVVVMVVEVEVEEVVSPPQFALEFAHGPSLHITDSR
jgi:hypothetical protein